MTLIDGRAPDRFGPPLPYRTAQAVVAHRLRRAILSGALPPGSRLLQAVIAEEMQTSTTPVREAMRELGGEGLLDLDPHRGVVVHQCRPAELAEIFHISTLLEPVAVAASVENISPAELAEAERLLVQMERETDPAEWVILNAAFHAVLSDASRLPMMTAILRKLRNVQALYIASSLHEQVHLMVEANAEHRKLLEACKARDVQGAIDLQLSHLAHTVTVGGVDVTKMDLATAASS